MALLPLHRVVPLLSVIGTIAGLLHGQADFQPKVDHAILAGTKAVVAAQMANGAFDTRPGLHALLLLAILHGGVPEAAPPVKRAIDALRSPTDQTYDMAIRLMVLAHLRDPRFDDIVRADAARLISGQCDNGAWGYGVRSRGGFDNSNTQYAMLGLHAAAQLAVQVPASTWRRAAGWLVSSTAQGGGAGYSGPEQPTVSMSVGLISSLEVVRAHLDPQLQANVIERVDEAVRVTLRWLDRHWSGGRDEPTYYALYGTERAMTFAAVDKLAGVDWYRVGASWLMARQSGDGTWDGHADRRGRRDLSSTAFAILFLSRATRQWSGETAPSVGRLLQALTAAQTAAEIRAATNRLIALPAAADTALLSNLESPDRALREAAILALHARRREVPGYDPARTAEENRAAIERLRADLHLNPARGPESRPG